MYLKVMKQLRLEITRPYVNVCGIDSKIITPVGVVKNVDLNLFDQPMVGCPMDIAVIETPDSYGMLLSREWTTFIGGYLKMDLSHMIIPYFDL